MKAKYEWPSRQPEPIPVLPPSGKVIQFPIAKPETKIGNMSCCKAQMMDWNFTRGL